VAQTDHAVGEMLRALDRLELTDRTLVIFTSDNGAHWLPREIEQYQHAANGAWRGQKADIHEGGHRVPCIVRWPGRVRGGTVTSQLACLTDFMATFAELLGVSLPEAAAEDSFSFAYLLLGRARPTSRRQSLVLHSSQGMFALRRDGWKLIEGLGSGGFTAPAKLAPRPGGVTGQLYDLFTDPGEKHDRFASEPGRVAALTAELARIRTEGRSRPVGHRTPTGGIERGR
jgi:arylsulfatase A-like enzyme